MANIKSAKKRVLVSRKKAEANKGVRSAVKTRISRVRRLLDGGDAAPTAELTLAVSTLDRAAQSGVLHPNNAARRKSRLMRAAARAAALAADPELAAKAAAEAKSHAKGTGKQAVKKGVKKSEIKKTEAKKADVKKADAKRPAAAKAAAKPGKK